MADAQTVDEIRKDITEKANTIVGQINNVDSKKEKTDIVLEVLNQIIAGVDLSKVEKAGTLVYLMNKRTG